MKVLVVDDNRDAADSLSTLLSLYGCEVHATYSGEDCLQLAEQLRPDLVLLDIGLPGIDGHETCRRLRQQEWARHTTIVAVTAWGDARELALARAAGFTSHHTKPVDPAVLASIIHQTAAG